MNIPTRFKAIIKQTFADKEVLLFDTSVVKEADGWTRKGQYHQNGSFMANVLSNFAEIQEEYGIVDQFDLAMTTSDVTTLPKGQVIQYGGIFYKVSDVKSFDSHILIIAKKWSSKLSTSISV